METRSSAPPACAARFSTSSSCSRWKPRRGRRPTTPIARSGTTRTAAAFSATRPRAQPWRCRRIYWSGCNFKYPSSPGSTACRPNIQWDSRGFRGISRYRGRPFPGWPFVLLALLAVFLVAAPVSPDVSHTLVGGALSDGVAYSRLEELTDTIGPRLTGSPGAEAAVKWALQKFQQDGLEARLERVMVPHWVRGEEHGEILPQPGIVGHPLALT